MTIHHTRLFILATTVLAFSSTLAGPVARPADPGRYRELARVVHRHLGFAHFTRGVNMCTILALHDAATPADLPTLAAMIHDKDRLVSMAAAQTLASMGDAGVSTLKNEQTTLQDPSRRVVEEAVGNADSIRRAIDHYRGSGDCDS